MLFEKVGEKFHGIGPDDRNVVVVSCRVGFVPSCVSNTERSNAVVDVLCDLHTYLEAKNSDVGIKWCVIYEKPTESTPNVGPFGSAISR